MDKKTAQKIVKEIIGDLNDRRGCGIDGLDDDIQREIRKTWTDIVLKNAVVQQP
jgi:hypothetical protein